MTLSVPEQNSRRADALVPQELPTFHFGVLSKSGTLLEPHHFPPVPIVRLVVLVLLRLLLRRRLRPLELPEHDHIWAAATNLSFHSKSG